MDAFVSDAANELNNPSMVNNAGESDAFGNAMRFAETIAARICHDVAGPLGALAGTLQMALEGSDAEAGALATELVDLLTARVRLLRMAFGGGEPPSPASLQGLLPALPGAERLRLDLSGLPQSLPEKLRSLTPILLLLAASSLPRGGMIVLALDAGALVLRVDGPRAGWPDRLASCVVASGTSLADADEPRSIAVLIACLQVQALGLGISLDSSTSLRISHAR